MARNLAAGRTTDFVMVLGMIGVSASLVPFINSQIKLLAFGAWSLGYFLTRPKLASSKDALGLVFLLVLVSSALLVPLLNAEPDVSPYATTIAFLCIGYALARVLPLDVFSTVYVNILTVLAVVSLGFWALGFQSPALVARLPLVEGEFENYANAYVHVFIVSRGLGTEGLVNSRNSGVAWEAGAYAILLVLALGLLLYRAESSGLRRGDAVRVTVLVVTVLSTVSFTGLFCLGVLAFSFRKVLVRIARSSPWVGVLGIAIVAVGLLLAVGQVRATGRYGNGTVDMLERISIERLDSLQLTPWFVMGSSFSTFDATGLPIWNSILLSFIVFGWVFSTVLLFLYWRFAFVFAPHSIGIMLVLLAGFSTEEYFRSVLFVYCAFAGFMDESELHKGATSTVRSETLPGGWQITNPRSRV